MVIAGLFGAIYAAWKIHLNVEDEIRLPATVIQVVIMKMDCAVLLGTLGPVILAAVPVPAFNGTGRQIHCFPIATVSGNVDNPGAGHLTGEIPARQRLCAEISRYRILNESGLLRRRHRPARHLRRIDFAVVVTGRRRVTVMPGRKPATGP